ncbi:hypothetical protein [Paenibacillus sp. NPDC057967]|uniref:hypothetical protein n=1 Tax=Paenibacillus sp. NPDC057967 TaxID=3346293 RepID=UPI0036DA4B08
MIKRPTKRGDKVRIVNAERGSLEDYGYQNGDVYEVKCLLSDGEPCIWPDGDPEREVYLGHSEYEVIDEELGASTKSTAQQLAEARAKVAELETKLRDETVGSVAIVRNSGYHEDIPVGTFVKVTEVDEDYEDYPYKAELLDGSDYDRFDLDSLEIVTYDSARAHLIAEVDRQLAEAFPGAAA